MSHDGKFVFQKEKDENKGRDREGQRQGDQVHLCMLYFTHRASFLFFCFAFVIMFIIIFFAVHLCRIATIPGRFSGLWHICRLSGWCHIIQAFVSEIKRTGWCCFRAGTRYTSAQKARLYNLYVLLLFVLNGGEQNKSPELARRLALIVLWFK